MKQYEKRAIENAIWVAKDRVDDIYGDYDEHKQKFDDLYKKRIAIEAVKLAQFRAGRAYDWITEREAIKYAISLVDKMVSH